MALSIKEVDARVERENCQTERVAQRMRAKGWPNDLAIDAAARIDAFMNEYADASEAVDPPVQPPHKSIPWRVFSERQRLVRKDYARRKGWI